LPHLGSYALRYYATTSHGIMEALKLGSIQNEHSISVSSMANVSLVNFVK